MKSSLTLLGVPVLVAFGLAPTAPPPTVAAANRAASPGFQWTTGAVGTLGNKVYTAPGEYMIDLEHEGVYDPAVGWFVLLDYNTLTIQQGASVRFRNHPTNAPVVIRAVGDIVIDGVLNLDGATGHSYGEPASHALPGPGGFRGGTGKKDSSATPVSAGYGPGGARVSTQVNDYGGFGSYATLGPASFGLPGATYGSPTITPLIGGSGGGGGVRNAFPLNNGGGGAGGGAILIGSDSAIRLTGTISARGGDSGLADLQAGNGERAGGAGSGGAIRLASPTIVQQAGQLVARGGQLQLVGGPFLGGDGRIRVERIGPSNAISASPPAVIAPLGEFLPTTFPTVTLLSWWNDLTSVWEPIEQDPRANITSSGAADELLPSSGLRIIRIEGHGVPLGAPLEVRTTYTRGNAVVDKTQTMGTVTGSSLATSWTDVTIDFALGVSTVQVRAVL